MDSSDWAGPYRRSVPLEGVIFNPEPSMNNRRCMGTTPRISWTRRTAFKPACIAPSALKKDGSDIGWSGRRRQAATAPPCASVNSIYANPDDHRLDRCG